MDEHDDDPLAAARGIVLGTKLAVKFFWAPLAAAVLIALVLA